MFFLQPSHSQILHIIEIMLLIYPQKMLGGWVGVEGTGHWQTTMAGAVVFTSCFVGFLDASVWTLLETGYWDNEILIMIQHSSYILSQAHSHMQAIF